MDSVMQSLSDMALSLFVAEQAYRDNQYAKANSIVDGVRDKLLSNKFSPQSLSVEEAQLWEAVRSMTDDRMGFITMVKVFGKYYL